MNGEVAQRPLIATLQNNHPYCVNIHKKHSCLRQSLMAEKKEPAFDPLDMHNYRVEKLPIRDKSGVTTQRTLSKIPAH
ncbi:MAG: hypothetical protein KZQ58_12295 [gamma proteobacterium symbiont of Bathyaustriella thionipta]|nr:hypothetical protein [gamma proteobacterium symbiont of Bathyaustriella thionipta]